MKVGSSNGEKYRKKPVFIRIIETPVSHANPCGMSSARDAVSHDLRVKGTRIKILTDIAAS